LACYGLFESSIIRARQADRVFDQHRVWIPMQSIRTSLRPTSALAVFSSVWTSVRCWRELCVRDVAQ
jgi:hypothetical protein